jgi:RNA polymerase-interacting CarD/CdnL/TRCF family regulator
MVPFNHAEKIGMRTALSEKNLENVWQTLREHPMGLPARHKKRYEILEEKFGTGKIHKIAEVVRDLRWRSMQFNRLNVPGERIYKKAKRFLVGEIAVSQSIDFETAEIQLERRLTDNLLKYIAHV